VFDRRAFVTFSVLVTSLAAAHQPAAHQPAALPLAGNWNCAGHPVISRR